MSGSADGGRFARFDPELPRLLRELRRNNSREWFTSHRQALEQQVTAPLRELAERLGPLVAGIDPQLKPKVSRFQRDVRFSRDKSPYRSNAWLAFQHPVEAWVDTPAFFFELNPEGHRCGMGFYSARAATLRQLRSRALERPGEYLAAYGEAAAAEFEIAGECYRRPPAAEPGLPEPIAELLRHRELYFVREGSYGAEFFAGEPAALLAEGFSALAGLYRFLNESSRAVAPATG